MDVAVRRPGKGREQERKLEGDAFRLPPHPYPLPEGAREYNREDFGFRVLFRMRNNNAKSTKL